MLKRHLILLVLIANITLSKGQQALWKDHFSYQNCQHIAETNNYIAASTGLALMVLNKNNDEIISYSSVNGLNGNDISAIQALPNDQFIIGYNNGNIDIVSTDGVVNIPDLKNKHIRGDKNINHFYINAEYAYCSTNFALIVVNIEKYEIADTYYLGINSEDLAIFETITKENYIYAATDRGLLKADINDPRIAYYEAWQEISGSTLPVVAINNYHNKLIFVKKQALNYSVLYGGEETWIQLDQLTNFESLNASFANLVITHANIVESYDNNFINNKTITNYTINNKSEDALANFAIYSDFEEAYFIADQQQGLVKVISSGENALIANGPLSNISNHLLSANNGIYTVVGSSTQIKPAEYSFLNQDSWSGFQPTSDDENTTWQNLLKVCSSQADDSKVYFSSWGSGLFELNDNELTVHTETTSGLQANNGEIKVSGLSSDKNGNIWMVNAEVNSGIVVKTDDNWYRNNYSTTSDIQGTSELLMASNNYLWMTINTGGYPQLLIADTNGTVTDDTDDRYRGPIHPSAEPSDNRNRGQLKLWDENQDIITNTVYTFVEDKNESIWLGTDKGVLVYYSPWSIFEDDYPIASRIKVPRNDGSNLADYLLEKEKVTCIAIDGANRKWLGTQDAGLYLVSENGLKTYESFNIDNSPLPSNHIISLAISPVSGEVYIATSKGIVSYKGKATEGGKSFDKVYAYPNPVREDFTGDITITGLMQNSTVKITTTSGRLVYETLSLGGKAYWNGKNFNGEEVKTGVYIIYSSSDEGQHSAVTKILIVR